jgi:pimeloyl-ACP methyl ester carboxylesterase
MRPAASLPASYPAEIPCLYLGASDDPAFPPPLFTEKSKAKLFPGANLTSHIIRGGNHFMHQVSHCSYIGLKKIKKPFVEQSFRGSL